MISKSFLKDSSAYTLTSIFSKGLSIFLLPLYIKFLSKEEYGLLDLILIVANFVNVTVSFELTQYLARYLPNYRLFKAKKILISTCLWVVVISYTSFLIVFILGKSIFLEYIFTTQIDYYVYIQIGVYIYLNGLYLFLQNNLKWEREVTKYVLNNLLYVSTSIIILIVLFSLKYGFLGVMVSYNLALLGSIIFLFIIHKKYYGFIFSKKYALKAIKFSSPLILSSLSIFFSLFTDRILITQFLNLNKLASYTVAYKFGSIITLFSSGFSNAFLPIIYKNPFSLKNHLFLKNLFQLFSLIVILFLVILALFGNELLINLTNQEYLDANNIILITATSLYFSKLNIFFPGLFVLAKTKIFAFINLSSAILNIVLGFFLINKFQLLGIAYSTLITSLYFFLLNFFYSYRLYSKIISLYDLTLIFTCVVLPYLIQQIIFYFDEINDSISFSFKLFILIMGLLIVFFKTKPTLKNLLNK